jgi:ribosomal protein L40E
MDAPTDHYNVLGLTRDATQEEITQAYRTLVRRHAGDKKRFDEITEAFMTLSDLAARAQYDERIAHASPAAAGEADKASKHAAETVACASCGAVNQVGSKYCSECGYVLPAAPPPEAGRPKLGIARVIPPDPEPALTLEKGEILIGRAPGCQILLKESRYVSAHHARIVAEMGIFSLEDLGSTNGTLLNGTRVEPNKLAKLSDGDVIGVGDVTIRFEER